MIFEREENTYFEFFKGSHFSDVAEKQTEPAEEGAESERKEEMPEKKTDEGESAEKEEKEAEKKTEL